jgi:hypothetical protein
MTSLTKNDREASQQKSLLDKTRHEYTNKKFLNVDRADK